jgi:hypothetical protein
VNGVSAVYNERSWAIDLIGHLKRLAGETNRSIKDAGGEQTVKAEGGSLFPDVLLFGDRATARILQGWELKMPDTGIGDPDFRDNAETKARALGLDSFLLWNVSVAHLYVRDRSSDQYECSRVWDDLQDISTRTAVVPNRRRWEELAQNIFGYLNDLFDRGSLEGRQFIDAYRSGGVTALIMENAGHVAEALMDAARRNGTMRAEMTLWWDRSKAEYSGGEMDQVLAQAVLSNWIGKMLFGHILREQDQRAQRVAEINDETTPEQALELFREISEDCNFWTIFSDSLGLRSIPTPAWDQLKQFNQLLSDLRVGSVDQAQLSNVLEATVEVAVRKLRGQYTTPIELARLLAHLCIRDTVNDRVLDPCCGSGTIIRAALEQKLAAGVAPDQAAATIFAGDQDPQAVQTATLALAKPSLMHMPLRIFQRDAFSLRPDTAIEFRDPSNGALFTEVLGTFAAIASNLPFVAQEGREQYGNALDRVAASLGGNGERFTRRADVAAYLPFSFHPLLADGGRLGVIITNAWLGTDWGDAFYDLLGRFYDLKCVVASGAGRWFQNSDVVTNILILEKKTTAVQPSGDVKFVVLTRPLEELADVEAVQIAAAQIELGQTQNETMTIRSVSPQRLEQFRQLGLGGNAQFVNCDWVLDLPLTPLKDIFKVSRGERRGMNALFYPRRGHGIEAEYIKPLAKSPTDFTRLRAPAAKEAFSCSRSEQELEDLGHTGALNWIRRFRTPENMKKLGSGGLKWYEMRSDTLTDLVMFINYGDRLFVGRVDPPAFADQRLVRLEPHDDDLDLDLAHALLNSTVSMFIIEGMGFGRGLGALDLNKDRIEDYMHMLDATKLNEDAADAIKAAFAPLRDRDVLIVADELERPDRQNFDDAVLAALAPGLERERIYEALLSLVEIRRTAVE